jgi:prophage antirepressor-like protein
MNTAFSETDAVQNGSAEYPIVNTVLGFNGSWTALLTMHTFTFNGHKVRAITKLNEQHSYWSLDDICNVLGITDALEISNCLNKIIDRDGVVRNQCQKMYDGEQDIDVITQYGMLKFITSSNKANAKEFKSWLQLMIWKYVS